MAESKGFKFTIPEREQETQISQLTSQFSRISADDDGSRANSFRAFRSPMGSRSRAENQEKRRREALERQKQQREDTLFKARQIALDVNENESTSSEDEEESEEIASNKRGRDSDSEMHEATKIFRFNPKSKKKGKKNKKKNIHANQIMYSETMETVPEDLLTNWTMMICPKGKRCLVTSRNGQTIARTRGGKIMARFQSRLPNGSRTNRGSEFCILDCIYDAVHWTFYVLDIMCWRGYPIFDCDTNFRHFWLKIRLEENELDRPDGENQFYKFIPLKPVSTADTPTVAKDPEQYVNQQGFTYHVDGLLFYHQQAHYQGGTTPLVCWVDRDSISTMLQ